jgi:prepilin-type N-terminal cleavage/methylation domain-containing protein
MTVKTPERVPPCRSQSAFSLIEAMVATAIVGVVCVGMYAGVAAGFAVIDQSRENMRATQLLLEKMETIRLYSWDQIKSNGFIPSTFVAPFTPGETNAITNRASVYWGTVTITDASGLMSPVTEAYSNDIKFVTITLSWQSGQLTHSRIMKTLIARYGLQNYVY